MPAVSWGWEITPAELESWMIARHERWVAIDKPPLVVCHPSKHGPWSSLVGACREYFGVERVHVPFRLDRETSGAVVVAIDSELGAAMQRSVQNRRVHKVYQAILCGRMEQETVVDAPLGRRPNSAVIIRQGVVEGGQAAVTRFIPLACKRDYTLVRVEPETGRLHQVRAHAAHIGHALVGDKIYGPDETLFLDFLENGYTGRVAAALPLARHALHCTDAVFDPAPWEPAGLHIAAPLAADMAAFWQRAQ